MWSMWNAPSDRDYYDQFAGWEPPPEDRCFDCGAYEEQACEWNCATRQLATQDDIDPIEYYDRDNLYGRVADRKER